MTPYQDLALKIIKKKDDIRHYINLINIQNHLDLNDVSDFIKENYDSFPNFGGDIETWFFNIRVAHSLRVFGLHPRNRKTINKEDLEIGFKLFKKDKKKEEPFNHMYL